MVLVTFSENLPRPRALLAVLLALVALLAVACGGKDDPSPSPSPAADDGYAMPDGWPVETFPLPPGATPSSERVSDELVSFHLDGVDLDTAAAFYDDALAELGVERGASLVTDPVAYDGGGLHVTVGSGDLGDLEVYVKRS